MTEVPSVSIADVRAAQERLKGQAIRTPLHSSAYLDAVTGGRILLKCENLQRTGSFKFRGAYNALSQLSEEERAKGVLAISSGNHAQGVAEAARIFGMPATIIMPADAPAIKIARTERSGAKVITYDRAREDRDAMAETWLAKNGGTLVHPFNDVRVIAGQGTTGLEIGEQATAMGANSDIVLVPCSGGGLTAGVALAVKSAHPGASIYAVEPEGFDDYRRSLEAGTPLTNERTSGSISDALLAPKPGAIGFALNRRNLRGALAVSDQAALAAVAFAFNELKLVVEPGGAIGLAAVLSGAVEVEGRTVIVVLTGGNIDPPVLASALVG